ncbi:unnamed protein product [Linum trigynum]|uniref:LOB domain-containing protein n=1 Tax=Linum trigynum TaxID=586398 RepID=A0AAV2E3W1_9ROSI
MAKLLSEFPITHREEVVNFLAYEADARLQDPIYGCLSRILFLQHQLKQLHMDLEAAKKDLIKYMGPQAHHHQAIIINNTTNNSVFQQQQQNGNNMIHMHDGDSHGGGSSSPSSAEQQQRSTGL